jgi:2-phospho-L-lactate guanylyltransferase
VSLPCWAVVPAKSLARGKSRLQPVLGEQGRARFARGLLEHVLGVLASCDLGGVLVATDGDDVAALALERGAHVRRDRGEPTLAQVVDRALEDVARRGASSAVVLMADLPRIEAADVHGLLAALADHDVVLVRDHLGRHTNALAVAPPTAMATCFGARDSFRDHCAAAAALGLRLSILENERISFDVDGPADHARLSSGEGGLGGAPPNATGATPVPSRGPGRVV